MSVLKALKSSGIYEANHLLPTRAGFHELDLNAFTNELLDLPTDLRISTIQGEGTVTVRSILCGRRDSVEIKLNVVRAVLSRHIVVLANSDGTAGGLAIGRGAYQQIVAGSNR